MSFFDSVEFELGGSGNGQLQVYGISPYGFVTQNSARDFIEGKMLEEQTSKSVDKFIKAESNINKSLKALDTKLNTKMKQNQPQTVGGAGNLFRIKPSARRSKYA